MDQGRRHDVIAGERVVEFALGDLLGGFLAERILAGLLQRLAQIVEDFAECALGGAVANKALVVLEFDIEAVDVDGRQPRGAVTGDARGGHDFLSHFAPCQHWNRGTTGMEPVGFTAGSDGLPKTAEGPKTPEIPSI